MGINKAVSYLEGVRSATANNATTFPISVRKVGSPPPDTEYLVYSKTSSLLPEHPSFGISKNTKVRRFGWNGFKRSWCLLPGGSPESVGVMGDVISVSISDTDLGLFPIRLSVGVYPSEVISFSISLVTSAESFTTVLPGSVEISTADGLVNFNSVDISSFVGKPIFFSRQDGFDFSTSDGSVGVLSSQPSFAISPIPPVGSTPRIRIGLQEYLTQVDGNPASGQFRLLPGGGIDLSLEDVLNNSGESVYYDGIEDFSFSLSNNLLVSPSTIVYPESIGNIGQEKSVVVLVSNRDGTQSYFKNVFSDTASPSSGEAVIRSSGDVFISSKYSSPEKNAFVHKTSFEFDGLSIEFNRASSNQVGVTSGNDFFHTYHVDSQVLSRNITQAPFFSLQNLPLDDGSLSYSIAQGVSSSTFTGPLLRASDPESNGLSYLVDSKTKQLRFYSSESFSFTTTKPESVIKIPGAAILDRSFKLTIDGEPKERGTDFFFDSSTGLLTFLKSVGQDFDSSLQGLQGRSFSQNLISVSQVQVDTTFLGKKVLVKTGPNTGVYDVIGVFDSSTVVVSPAIEDGSFTCDFRSTSDVLTSHFWEPVNYFAPNVVLTQFFTDSGPSRLDLSSGFFSISAPKGQVNFSSPLPAGSEFSVEYQVKNSDGTVSTFIDFSAFQISLEEATYVKNSTYANFNPENLKLTKKDKISVYIDGVPVDPNVISLDGNKVGVGVPLVTQRVTVTYFVSTSRGGERTYQLSNSDIYLDDFSYSGSSFTIPGERVFSPFNAVLVDDSPFFVVGSSVQDGKTNVSVSGTLPSGLTHPSLSITRITPSDFDNTPYLCGPIINGSSSFKVFGQVSLSPGQLFHTDNENVFSVVSSSYSSGETSVSFYPPSPVYISSGLLSFSSVVSFPTSELQTNFDLSTQFPLTLVDVGNHKVLSGYTVSDGGKINLSSPVSTRVEAFYVARNAIPSGSVLEGEFARMIAPSASNFLGQRLLSSYSLVSPDSWYFRVSSSTSLLSSVIEDVSYGSSTSGPNVQDATDPTNSDFGVPSPYYNATKYLNFDSFVSSLIGYYNSFLTTLDQIRSSMDGSVVGGSNGPFRYSGFGATYLSYHDVQNDVLDTVADGDQRYRMSEYNRFSRLFKTAAHTPVRLNDKVTPVLNFRNTLGNLGIGNLTDVDQYITYPSRSFFKTYGGNTLYLTSSFRNGYMVGGEVDESHLVPEFFSGQKVNVYAEDGTKLGSSTVISVDKVVNTVILSSSFDVVYGHISADVSDSTNPGVHFYGLGHIKTDFDTGVLKNNVFPSPLGPSNPLVGNEVVSTDVSFSNSSTSPKRIPALFGSRLNDDSSVPRFLLKHKNELDFIDREVLALSKYGFARVTSSTVISDSTVSFVVGDKIRFESGPNTAGEREVVSVSGSTFVVDLPFSVPDGVLYPIYRVYPFGSPKDVALGYQSLLFGSLFSPQSEFSPGTLNGSIQLCYDFVSNYCDNVTSGSCSGSIESITDTSADFFLSGVSVGDYVLTDVAGGLNGLLARVVSFTKTSVTLDRTVPTGSFIYSVFSPSLDTSAFDFISSHLSNCISFYSLTSGWVSIVSPMGAEARIADLASRKAYIEEALLQLSSLVQPLYEDRFLWIDQKVNKVTGYLSRYEAAAKQASEDVTKLISNQGKISSIRRLQ